MEPTRNILNLQLHHQFNSPVTLAPIWQSPQYNQHLQSGKLEDKSVLNLMKTKDKIEFLHGEELSILILQSTYFTHPLAGQSFPALF